MNICYYSSASGYGGAEKYLETLAVGCLNQGFSCTVILSQHNKRFQESLQRNNLSWYKINGFNDLIKTIKNIKPDFIHINLPGPWGAHGIALLSKIAGVKNIVTTEHLPMFGPSVRHSPIKYFDTKFIDRTITVSYENQLYLETIHKIKAEKISVVHNGIDTELFDIGRLDSSVLNFKKHFNILPTDFVFGIVGRITEQKGHRFALKAFSQIVERYNDVKLIIIGDGELQQEMIEITKENNMGSQVIFAGFQSNMPPVYAGLDVLLMPSLFEALPLTLLEAMSTGTPAIASEVNGIPEVIKNNTNGLLVPSKNHQILMKNMELLYQNRSLVSLLGKAAVETVKKQFSITQMVYKTIEVYEKVKNC